MKQLGWAVVVVLAFVGCKNKDYENCLQQADAYEKAKLACLALADKAAQEACTDKNEVSKITREDCASAFK